MSKASEWAEHRRPSCLHGNVFLQVAEGSGNLEFSWAMASGKTITPEDARNIARWILDIFGEAQP